MYLLGGQHEEQLLACVGKFQDPQQVIDVL